MIGSSCSGVVGTVWSSRIVCVIIPYNGPESSLEADLHVQWVGTLEVDIDDDVPDNEISGQGEVVSVDGMSPIVLWHKKNESTYVYADECRCISNSDLPESVVSAPSHAVTLNSDTHPPPPGNAGNKGSSFFLQCYYLQEAQSKP